MNLANLRTALDQLEEAKACVRKNRGDDKEMARQAVSEHLAEIVLPALIAVVTDLDDDRRIESIAKRVLKTLEAP